MKTAKGAWSVVVIYETQETREAAVSFCDQLVQRFWHDFEFDVSWWETGKLQETASADQARRHATAADLVVFALPPDGEVAPEVQSWIDTWVAERGDREGAVVGLVEVKAHGSLEAAKGEQFLRSVAHRAGMDYLTQVPQSISWQIPESLESCTERARQVTHVLDDILHQPAPPPPIGLR